MAPAAEGGTPGRRRGHEDGSRWGRAAGCGRRRLRGAVEVSSRRPGAQVPYACDAGGYHPRGGLWMTEGELPFDPETRTSNEQEQVRASLERLAERLAEW
jgi:hypothetical protein